MQLFELSFELMVMLHKDIKNSLYKEKFRIIATLISSFYGTQAN